MGENGFNRTYSLLKEYSREPDEAEGIWRVDEE
jgi:hypothetical protein